MAFIYNHLNIGNLCSSYSAGTIDAIKINGEDKVSKMFSTKGEKPQLCSGFGISLKTSDIPLKKDLMNIIRRFKFTELLFNEKESLVCIILRIIKSKTL